MKVDIAPQTSGGIQFVILAENDSDQVVIDAFQKQAVKERVEVRGYVSGQMPLGPGGIRVGTVKK